MKHRRYLFTLMELLIIVAIIAIFITLLLPALRQAREKAFSMQCGNNLKTFAFASIQYSMDYDDWLLRTYMEQWDEYTYTRTWYYNQTGLLWPYVKAGKSSIRLGYSNSTASVSPFACPTSAQNNRVFGGTYGINYIMSRNYTYKRNQLLFPSQTFHFAEKFVKDDLCEIDKSEPNGKAIFPHQFRSNIAFIDGHCGNISEYQFPAYYANTSLTSNASVTRTFWRGR